MSEHNDIPSVVRKRLRERCERREREMIRGGARGVSAKYTILRLMLGYLRPTGVSRVTFIKSLSRRVSIHSMYHFQ